MPSGINRLNVAALQDRQKSGKKQDNMPALDAMIKDPSGAQARYPVKAKGKKK